VTKAKAPPSTRATPSLHRPHHRLRHHLPGCSGRDSEQPGVPCGPWPGTLESYTTYLAGNCQTATVPEVDCATGLTLSKIYGNCYRATGKKKKIGTCTPSGHKTLIAGKNWHGTAPFGGDQCPTLETMGTCGDCPAPTCTSVPANLTPASKKYRTITVSYTKTNNSGGGFTVALGVEQFTYNASNSVDKWGKMTRTASGAKPSNSFLPMAAARPPSATIPPPNPKTSTPCSLT
jgi:hypothetical protein